MIETTINQHPSFHKTPFPVSIPGINFGVVTSRTTPESGVVPRQIYKFPLTPIIPLTAVHHFAHPLRHGILQLKPKICGYEKNNFGF
jgi:hypothetical protein